MKLNLFICLLCCGRIELLEKTLRSFKQNCVDLNDYELKIIVSDDSGDSFLNEGVKRKVADFFKDNCEINYRFGENVGQAASYWHISNIINQYAPSENDVAFTLEEDWEFVEEFRIKDLAKIIENKNPPTVAAVLRTDVDNFESYPYSGYNIYDKNNFEMLIASKEYTKHCKISGNSPHNDIISFHPGLINAKLAASYSKHYSLGELIRIKESSEKLLGVIAPGLRSFILDKSYANHTGDYRIFSVFEGAKIRNGMKILNLEEYKRKITNEID